MRQIEACSNQPEGFDDQLWRGVLASAAHCCAAACRWEDLLMLQELLSDCGVPVGKLHEQLQGQVLVACLQLGEWELGASSLDSCGRADWKARGGLEVQEAAWALHANPKQGLRGLRELAGQGHPVGPMAVKGLLASCQRGGLWRGTTG
jgi:hypothetical protein